MTLPARVEAVDIFWDGGAAPVGLDGIFSTISNWSPIPNLPDRSPGPNDVAHFGTSVGNINQNVYTVSFTTNPTNQAVVVEDDSVTFDLSGHLYTMAASNPITLGVASGFTFLPGELTIKNGFVIVPSDSLIKIGASRGGIFGRNDGRIAGWLAANSDGRLCQRHAHRRQRR